MKKTRTRLWSILLTVAMLLTLLPTTALAGDNVAQIVGREGGYETLQAAIEAAGNTASKITLLKDVENGSGIKITEGQDITHRSCRL